MHDYIYGEALNRLSHWDTLFSRARSIYSIHPQTFPYLVTGASGWKHDAHGVRDRQGGGTQEKSRKRG